jgi:creatinine amidohydrolase
MSGNRLAYVLEEMTVNEIRQALKKTKTVLLPMGCIEQHGYHLPINTDVLTACYVAGEAAKQMRCFVAPAINYTFSGGELPGTINISTQVVGLYVREVCRSFAQQGFRKIVLVLGHGGSENLRDIQESLKTFLWLEKTYGRLRIQIAGLWNLSPTWTKSMRRHNYHADIVETSMILYLRPELVRKPYVLDKPSVHRQLIADPDSYQKVRGDVKAKGLLEGVYTVPHISQRADVKVGVMGDPKGASAATGEKVLNEAVANLVKLLKRK